MCKTVRWGKAAWKMEVSSRKQIVSKIQLATFAQASSALTDVELTVRTNSDFEAKRGQRTRAAYLQEQDFPHVHGNGTQTPSNKVAGVASIDQGARRKT